MGRESVATTSPSGTVFGPLRWRGSGEARVQGTGKDIQGQRGRAHSRVSVLCCESWGDDRGAGSRDLDGTDASDVSASTPVLILGKEDFLVGKGPRGAPWGRGVVSSRARGRSKGAQGRHGWRMISIRTTPPPESPFFANHRALLLLSLLSDSHPWVAPAGRGPHEGMRSPPPSSMISGCGRPETPRLNGKRDSACVDVAGRW